jgi:hypothetical protein
MKLHPLKRKRIIWTRKTISMLGTMTDAALALKLRVSVSTVFEKRRKLGIPASRPPNSIQWTRDMIATLGRIPDRDFAKAYGMNVLIGCYARNTKAWHYWTKKEIALLGKMPDGEVALRTGINKASVAWKRGKLKIPPFTTKRPKKLLTDWTLKEIAVLGTMTDAAAAAALDLAPSAVRLKRISLGIPPFGRSSSH